MFKPRIKRFRYVIPIGCTLLKDGVINQLTMVRKGWKVETIKTIDFMRLTEKEMELREEAHKFCKNMNIKEGN